MPVNDLSHHLRGAYAVSVQDKKTNENFIQINYFLAYVAVPLSPNLIK